MYLQAESVKVDSDEGALTLEIFGYANTPDADEVTLTVNIHGIDLDAFYDSVRSGVGGYLRERDEAVRKLRGAAAAANLYDGYPVFECDPDESGGLAEEYAVAVREDGSLRMERDEDAYDPTDPKHPRYHSTHVDIWDARCTK